MEQEIEELPQKSKIKKFFILIIGLILVFLVSTYYLFAFGADDVLAGFIQSSKIDNKLTLEFKDKKIIFTKDSYEELLKIYDENLEVEFKACLKGNVKNNIYDINKIIIPKTYSQTYKSVRAEPCDTNTLIDLHSHPFRRCLASIHDITNFRRLKSVNENILLSVMCERDRFFVYG
tara:strand:- start:269 stop:796 length:528 start_codon:yes stop_codon:yes gene_type:complete